MRYKLYEKVILKDDMKKTWNRGRYTPKMKHLKENLHPISAVSVNGYEVDGYYVEHEDIDHEKTIRLRKLEENNDNKS